MASLLRGVIDPTDASTSTAQTRERYLAIMAASMGWGRPGNASGQVIPILPSNYRSALTAARTVLWDRGSKAFDHRAFKRKSIVPRETATMRLALLILAVPALLSLGSKAEARPPRAELAGLRLGMSDEEARERLTKRG